MTEKKEFQVNKNTPFWDASLTDQERIDWLLKEMTVEEKLGYLASSSPDLPRLGIPGVSVGGEAAHGVEGRNDQNGLGKPDVTTSFPQPIGMSASWDPELIRQAGEVTGTSRSEIYRLFLQAISSNSPFFKPHRFLLTHTPSAYRPHIHSVPPDTPVRQAVRTPRSSLPKADSSFHPLSLRRSLREQRMRQAVYRRRCAPCPHGPSCCPPGWSQAGQRILPIP